MRSSSRLLVSFLAAILALASFAAVAPAKGKFHRRHGHGHRAARLGAAVALKRARALPAAKPRPASPPASESNSDLLFYGDKVSDFAMNQSAPGAVSEVADPAGSGQTALEMTVDNSDVAPVTPTSDPRAQLLSPSIINNGDEFWWSGKFFLPVDFPASVPGWLTVMEGPYGAPFDGTPPWHIEVNGEHIQWTRNDTYNYDVPWQMPLVRNKWIDVVVHERFASDGWVEMWVDGQQITFFSGTYNPNHEAATTRLPMATRDHSNDEGPNFTVIQSYRKANMFSSVSLFQGPMAIGRTRAAVE
ncbi:MAG: heparin lyase I family protein [Solirubrobacterales bacterium]